MAVIVEKSNVMIVPLKKAINPKIANLLNEDNFEIQVEAAKVVAKLNLVKKGDVLFELVKNSKSVQKSEKRL